MQDPCFEVVYLPAFGGGLRFSREALDAYRERTGSDFDQSGWGGRADPAMIAVVRELGRSACRHPSDASKVQFASVPEMYRDYWRLEEEDGYESVHVDYQQCKLDMIRRLVVRHAHEAKSVLLGTILDILDIPPVPGLPD